jgi:hypothetical protein
MQGRETRGILEPGSEAFLRYIRWMRDCFHSFRIVDTGQPLVSDVTITEAAFPGERQNYLPDAVISWTGVPPASRIHSDLLGTIEAECATVPDWQSPPGWFFDRDRTWRRTGRRC